MKKQGGIGFWTATAVGLGAIIGSGIFVLSGTAIAFAGDYAILAFAVVGIVALIIATELRELVAIAPEAEGGVYSYVRKAFGSELGFITGIIQYLSYATSIAVVALGFGSYAANILNLKVPLAPIELSIALIIALSFVNALSSRKASKADAVMVVIKLTALGLFFLFAMFSVFGAGHFSISNFSASPAQAGIGSMLAACIAIMFAYSGFQTIATIASKVNGGSSAGGKAIVLSVVISIMLYLAVVVSMSILAPSSKYTISADPLAFALHYSNAPTWVIYAVDIGAMFATASATLAMIMASSRMVYQISADGLLPRFFRKYNKEKDVAINGIVISAGIGIVTLFAGNVFVIAAISTFGILFYYMMAGISVVHFRRTGQSKGYRIPFYPYSVILSVAFLILLMYGIPNGVLSVGMTLILLLLLIYYLGREVQKKKPVQIRLFK